MKTIGVVGGVAWPSSIIYYQTINELIAQRLGGSGRHCAKLVLAQTDFDEVERLQVGGRWELVGEMIAEEANKLKAAGADFLHHSLQHSPRCNRHFPGEGRPSVHSHRRSSSTARDSQRLQDRRLARQ